MLDVIFILQFGVLGAALATVIAQGASGIISLVYLVKKYDILRMTKEEKRFDIDCIRTLCGMGVPMGLQYSITAIDKIVNPSDNCRLISGNKQQGQFLSKNQHYSKTDQGINYAQLGPFLQGFVKWRQGGLWDLFLFLFSDLPLRALHLRQRGYVPTVVTIIPS